MQQKQLEAVRDKYNLSRTPTLADVYEFRDTGSFASSLYKKNTTSNSKQQQQLEQIRDKYGLSKTPSLADAQEFADTGSWPSYLNTQQNTSTDTNADVSTDVTQDTSTQGPTNGSGQSDNNTSDIYASRDEYLANLLQAQNNEFDVITELQVNQYEQQQEDLERDLEYFNQDFQKVRSRKTQDYFTGKALQNKEFSKSLDFITNYAARSV